MARAREDSWIWEYVRAYSLSKITVIDYLRELFPDICADELNCEASIIHYHQIYVCL
jgi:hypothetical protein